jgi:nitrite reductase/ring-hydroxylating ferredoxin subunit
MPATTPSGLVKACALSELRQRQRVTYRHGRKQIAIFATDKGVFACNNRCPHEGYPLAVGTLSDGCVLTCNWHNWKFDLAGGQTLVGGDRLRTYPVTMRGDAVFLDLSEPPAELRREQALDSLREAFEDYDYDRMARELARLERAGAAPLAGLAAALRWSHERFEYGMTHAQAATADWLALRESEPRDAVRRLVPVLEAVAHLSWDCLREPAHPYASDVKPFDGHALVEAIEAEDEAAAIAYVRGGLHDGLGYADLEPWLFKAALRHYQDFGHSVIYVHKTGQIAKRLGAESLEPLVLPLVRSLVYAQREDLVPEFREYARSLARWDGQGAAAVRPEDFQGVSVNQALKRARAANGGPHALYHALLGALAWNLLHFDLAVQDRTDNPVSQNVGWLDFTHGITFANAVRNACGRSPELWPNGLAQMACFAGRNSGFLDRSVDVAEWRVEAPLDFVDGALAGLFDHGQPEHIVVAHYLKTLTAAREEIAAMPQAAWVPTLAAALNRLLHSPLKRRHAARTARQALNFVAQEG